MRTMGSEQGRKEESRRERKVHMGWEKMGKGKGSEHKNIRFCIN